MSSEDKQCVGIAVVVVVVCLLMLKSCFIIPEAEALPPVVHVQKTH